MSYEHDRIGSKEGIVLAALKLRARAAAEAHGAAAERLWRRAWWGVGLAAVVSTAATGALLFEAVAFMSSGLAVLLGGLASLWGVLQFYLGRSNAYEFTSRLVVGPPGPIGPAYQDQLDRIMGWFHVQRATWLGPARAELFERVVPRLEQALLVTSRMGFVVGIPLMLLLWLVFRIGFDRVGTTLAALGVSALLVLSALLVAAAWRLSALAAEHESAERANKELSSLVEEVESPGERDSRAAEGAAQADPVQSLQTLGVLLEAQSPPVSIGPRVPGKAKGDKRAPAAAPLRTGDRDRVQKRVTALIEEYGLEKYGLKVDGRAVRKAVRAYARWHAKSGGYPVITEGDAYFAALVVWRCYLFWPLVRDQVVSRTDCDSGWADRAVGMYRYEQGISPGFNPDKFFRRPDLAAADVIARVGPELRPRTTRS